MAAYSYTNDRNRYLSSLAYGNGDVVEYTYDDLGRVTREEYRENGSTAISRTVTYTYNETGNLSKMTDSKTGMTTTYSYDPLGRLVSSYETDGTTKNSSSYSYYATGDLKAESHFIKDTLYNTYYAYDSLRRVVAVKNGNLATGYTYDEFSRLTEKTTFAGQALAIETEITYPTAASGATSNQVLYYEMGTNNTNVQFGYTYDGNGNIIREIRNTNRTGSDSDGIINDRDFVTAYQYDRQDQLIRENNELAEKTWVWTYDNSGNITSKKEYTYTTGNLGTLLYTITYDYGNANWGDLLTSYNGRTITYDAIGNPLNDGIWSYTWEQGRLLTKMQSSSATWNYTYDAGGLRTSRSNGSTTYRYWYNDSGLLLRMEKGNTVYSFTYDPAGHPVSFTEGNDTYYYVLNQQGDVIGIVDDEGIYIVSYVYDAWGLPIKTQGTERLGIGERNPLRYRGYVYDTETELYYLQSRYYNPTWGRFINADDPGYMGVDGTPSSYNLFAYCGNNPVTRADDEGEFWNIVAGAIVGGAINFVSAVVSEVIEGNWELKDIGKIFISTTFGAAEGALTAICPGASSLISFTTNALDSYICDRINGVSVDRACVNAFFSGAIGAVGGAGGGDFKKGDSLMNNAFAARKSMRKGGLHPNVTKAAKNSFKKANKLVRKAYISGQLESLAYSGMSALTHQYVEHVLF